MPNMLMLLVGESFRMGPQVSRGRGGPESIPRQKLATMSHLRFIQHVKQTLDLDVDVASFTYQVSREESNALERWYSPHIIHTTYFPSMSDSEVHMFQRIAHELCKMDLSKYDYIFLNRFDFYIKETFLNIFRMDPNKNMYGYTDIYRWWGPDKFSFVGHYCMLTPKRFFGHILHGGLWTEKHSSHEWLQRVESREAYDFFVPTSHWSSTCLGYNPIFTNVGRKEYSKYDRESETIKHETNYMFETDVYNDCLETDTIEKNLQIYAFTHTLDGPLMPKDESV
jgi:hypothetical protein